MSASRTTVTPSGAARSVWTKWQGPREASEAKSVASWARRLVITTSAPTSSSAAADMDPSPRPPPVTSAVLPSSEKKSRFTLARFPQRSFG